MDPLGPLLDEELPLPRLLPPPGCLEDPSCYSPTPGAEGGGQVAGLCLLPLRQTYCSFPLMWSFKVSHLPPCPLHPSSPTGVSLGPSWKAAVTGRMGWKSGGETREHHPNPSPQQSHGLESSPGSSALGRSLLHKPSPGVIRSHLPCGLRASVQGPTWFPVSTLLGDGVGKRAHGGRAPRPCRRNREVGGPLFPPFPSFPLTNSWRSAVGSDWLLWRDNKMLCWNLSSATNWLGISLRP